MKILSASLFLVMAGVAAQAQQTTPPTPAIPSTAPVPARIVTEIMAGGQMSLVKGQPFSAEAVSESVQTLADGNRITRKWTNKLYRDGQGRFRREGSSGTGTVFGAAVAGDNNVTVIDPAGGRFYVDTDDKTVRVLTAPNSYVFRTGSGQGATVISGTNAAKIQEELKARGATGVTVLPAERATVLSTGNGAENLIQVERLAAAAAGGGSGQGGVIAPSIGASSRYDVRTESLGTQDFEGVMAEGTRTTTTIPADAIGNERPIEIVYERWYSKELQMIVYSKHSDPRFGEQTYRLTNINRSEPDPSLFEVPQGYKVVNSPSSTIYRTTAPKAVAERTAPTKVYVSAPAAKPNQ